MPPERTRADKEKSRFRWDSKSKQRYDEVHAKMEEMQSQQSLPLLFNLVCELSDIMIAEIQRLDEENEFIQEQVSLYVRDESQPFNIISKLQNDVHDLKARVSEVKATSRTITRANIEGFEAIKDKLDAFASNLQMLTEALNDEREYNDNQAVIRAELIDDIKNVKNQNTSLISEVNKLMKKGMVRKVYLPMRKRRISRLIYPRSKLKLHKKIDVKPSPPPPMSPDLDMSRSFPEATSDEEEQQLLHSASIHRETVLFGISQQKSTAAIKIFMKRHGVDYRYEEGVEGESLYPKLYHGGKIYIGSKEIGHAIRKTHPLIISPKSVPEDSVICLTCGSLNGNTELLCSACGDKIMLKPPIPSVKEIEESDEPKSKSKDIKGG